MKTQVFDIGDKVYVFNGAFYSGVITAINGPLYVVQTNREEIQNSSYFIYKKNADEEYLIQDLDFSINYLETIKNKLNYSNKD